MHSGEPPEFCNRLDMDMNKRKKGLKDDFKVFGLSNWQGKTAITEMVRSIKGAGLAGKIKT